MNKEDVYLISDATGVPEIWLPTFVRAKFKCELCEKSVLSDADTVSLADRWSRRLFEPVEEEISVIKGAFAVICPFCQEHICWDDYKSYIFKRDQAAVLKGNLRPRVRILNGLRMMVARNRKRRFAKIEKAKPLLNRLCDDKGCIKDFLETLKRKYNRPL